MPNSIKLVKTFKPSNVTLHSGAAIALLTKKLKILICLKYVNSQRTLHCGQFAF